MKKTGGARARREYARRDVSVKRLPRQVKRLARDVKCVLDEDQRGGWKISQDMGRL